MSTKSARDVIWDRVMEGPFSVRVCIPTDKPGHIGNIASVLGEDIKRSTELADGLIELWENESNQLDIQRRLIAEASEGSKGEVIPEVVLFNVSLA